MNKQELIKEIEGLACLSDSPTALGYSAEDYYVNRYQVLALIDRLEDESLEKVTEQQAWEKLLKYYPAKSTYDLKALLEDNFYKKKVVIPQFVADWIEECTGTYTMKKLFKDDEMPCDVFGWLFCNNENCELMARAWLDGYEI